MLKLRVGLVLALAVAALAVLPSLASAAISVDCSVSCSGPWVNHNVSVTFTWDSNGTDVPSSDCGTNGVAQTITDTRSLTCHVDYSDMVTPPVEASATVRIDRDPPGLGGAITPSRPPDFNGWYNHALSWHFPWGDALSGLGTCALDVPSNGAIGAGLRVHSSCADNAGNPNGADSPAFNYDDGGPTGITASPSRAPDHGGWYNHALSWTFTGSDAGSGILAGSCTTAPYAGPDSPIASVGGSCENNAGLTGTGASPAFKYDDTSPAVTGAAASRAPDHNGWYTHPVIFTFQGSDATSGIAGCTIAGYSGPDDGTASLRGSCSDNAGNASSRTISFKYDATAPDKAKLFAVPANGAIDINWSPPSDGDSYVLTRAPAIGGAAATIVYQGSAKDFVDHGLQNGTKYNYLLTVFDAAGNASVPSGISAVPDGSTLRPFLDTTVNKPPRLTWARVKKARYYNLQLFKGRKKILSTWPKRAHLQLGTRWKFNGHRYRLTPGLYRWYVWPGLGAQKRHRYGAMVGSSTFRVVP